MHSTVNTQRTQAWFDHLEETLATEAELVGLFEHSTVVGSAREFLVRRVLKSFLPPIVHVGSGKIIDAHGASSCQIDVVLFDSRLPAFEIEPGVGLYPIEGVLAAIEVKSTLTKKELQQALDNAASVLRLTPYFEPTDEWEARLRKLAAREGIAEEEAHRRLLYDFVPSTYVFAYNSRLRYVGLGNAVEKWFERAGFPSVREDYCAMLPRVIVAGRSLGLLDDGYVNLDPGEDVWAKWRSKHNYPVRHLLTFWNTKRRFGLLACHILHSILVRLGPSHASTGVRYTTDMYSPGVAYFDQDLRGVTAGHICWPERDINR